LGNHQSGHRNRRHIHFLSRFIEGKNARLLVRGEQKNLRRALGKRNRRDVFLQDNQPDLGSHVANAGYMVAPEARGKRVGLSMAEFSLAEARRLGYRAMQFNFVVKTNERAVKLWLALGFEIIGEIPEAFQHAENGLTNALIMYRKLSP
jgi:ribosomal protein S18 acetylase RimI-like enzyme